MKSEQGNFTYKCVQHVRLVETKAEKEMRRYQWTYATIVFFLGVMCVGITLAI